MYALMIIFICLCAIGFSLFFIINNEYRNYAEIFFLLIALFFFGLTINNLIVKKRTYRINYNYILSAIIIILCLGGAELYLRYIYKDNSDPPWFISEDDFRLNKAINRKNEAVALKHPHRFNDKIRSLKKEPNVYRLAVLGDSFIWGDRLSYDQIWSHKLEQRLLEAYGGQVEVLSWGRKGWSTLNEYHFFRKIGINYNPDALIVGYVPNDPDMGRYPQEYFKLEQVSIMRPLKIFFPNAIFFISFGLESLINNVFDIGYAKWEEKLYTDKNLQEYSELLFEFNNFCQKHKVPLLFVHTPPNYHPSYRIKFDLVAPLLKKARILYLDLYPVVARDLGHYPYYQLWANKANPHPGPLMTEVFAREVFEYLKRNHLRHLSQSKSN